MLVNIHFTNKNAKNIKRIFLFYRLRRYAASNGGSVLGFSFSKNEKYNILPNLINSGFIKDNKVVSYRRLCNINGCTGIWSNLPDEYLLNLNKFKGWVIASTEASYLRSSYRRQSGKVSVYSKRDKTFVKHDWYSCGEIDFFNKTKKIGDNIYSGRVYNKSISKMTSVSNRSISRWRKGSTNIYDIRKLSCSYPYILGRDVDKMYRTKDLSYITIDLLITSNIEVFTNKYYTNIKSPANKKLKNKTLSPQLL